MTRYLVVAYQTAGSPELIERLQEIATRDTDSVFTLLVPATPVRHLLAWQEGEAEAVARARAAGAEQLLREAGLPVSRSVIGPSSPISAIERHLADEEAVYEGIVITTFPLRLSRWLERDLPRRAEQRFGLPVLHVVAQPHADRGQVVEPDEEASTPGAADRQYAWELADAAGWRGRELIAWDGGRLGRVSEVLYDYESSRPVWLAVQSGLLGIRTRLVPVRGVQPIADHLKALYTTQEILSQPHVDIGQGFDSSTDQRALYDYFAVPLAAASDLRVLGAHAFYPGQERVITRNP